MTRPTFEDFKKKALQDKAVAAEYEVLKPEYALREQLIKMRCAAGLTQEEIAVRMGTKKASISRLESVHAAHSPRLETIEKYARAAGFALDIRFKPEDHHA
ncbi:MAG: helix-turn-helix transcriptional regulator [Rhodospirillales bacterium]|nr:helix-turn-helix transcriptional regulator [Rhodospirillales bacterium]